METVMDSRQIMKVLPHRFPFLLVDRVIKREQGPDSSTRVGHKVHAIKNVTFNEPYFTGHFPDLPVMPGVLQVEAMAQTACLAYVNPSDPKWDFFIASIQDAKFRRPVVPGDTLLLKAEIIKDRGSMIMLACSAEVEGKVVAEATILAKVVPKSERDA